MSQMIHTSIIFYILKLRLQMFVAPSFLFPVSSRLAWTRPPRAQPPECMDSRQP